jgi:hypothetical protein
MPLIKKHVGQLPVKSNPVVQCQTSGLTARSALAITNWRASWHESGPVHSSVLVHGYTPCDHVVDQCMERDNHDDGLRYRHGGHGKNNTDFPLLVGNTIMDVLGGSWTNCNALAWGFPSGP